MLMFHNSDTIEGVTVYGDHASKNTFYVLPDTPRFRMDRGKPVFRFLKYRHPIDRPDGKKGGGFVIFDVEFVTPEEKLKKVTEVLQERANQRWKAAGGKPPAPPVKIGQLSYNRGAAKLQLLDSGGALVEKIQNPGSPSLYGKMITPFTVELSPEGATLAEQALQGQGGVVQVIYDLYTAVRLPPVTAIVWFHASKFYSFYQKVDIDWSFWGDDDYKETLHENLIQSESAGVNIDPGAVTDQKVLNAVRDWAWGALEDAVTRMMVGDVPPVSEKGREVPGGIEHLKRWITNNKETHFSRKYAEGMAMEWNPQPRGTLPNITTMAGVKWQDHAMTVDLDDPFFKQLNVAMQVNADFQRLPLHSVEIHIDYPKSGGKKEIGEYRFAGPNDIAKFATYIDNDNWKYKWWYEVNYKGTSKTFKSPPVETDERILTVNVGDVGVLAFEIKAGDLDFEQVRAAQVTVQYEDKANGVNLIEKQFMLDQDHQEHEFTQMIFQPQRNPCKYRVKYLMKDGKEYLADWTSSWASPLVINDVWSATKTIGIRGTGLQDKVEAIFLDLKYTDAANKYVQTKSVVINESEPFFDWSFPVIDETGGKVTYSGTIKLRDGADEDIAETEAAKDTILVGPKILGFVEVEVLPDLIDWDQVKLAKVALRYVDSANAIDAKKDVIFRTGATDSVAWKVEQKDKNKDDYQWQATFFLIDGTQKKTDLETTSEPTLLPELPQ